MTTPELDLGKVLAALEEGGAALSSLVPPAPDPSTYLATFPELSAIPTRDVTIPGPGGDVLGRLYSPVEEPAAALVWVHGGGFAAGDLDMAEAHWVSLALAVRGVAVLSLDYRKAVGGVHYPAPSDDVLAGWLWAVEHRTELGGGSSLHLGGASAGGSLSAGVTKRLRDGAGEVPRSLLLVYPTLHPDLPPASEQLVEATAEIRATVPPQIMSLMSLNYAGSPAVLEDPYAFPGLGDLTGLPPTYVLNSDTDLLRASGEAFAADLASAGGDVLLELEPGTRHGHLNEPQLAEASLSIGRLTSWLNEHA